VFVALFAFGLAAAAAVWWGLPETLKHRVAEPITVSSTLRSYATFLRNRVFAVHLGIVAFTFMGLFAWISAAPFVLQDLYGLSPLQFGFAFAVASCGFMLGTLIAAAIVEKLGLDRTIALGAFTFAAGGLATVAAVALELKSAVALVLAAALYLAGMALAMPQAMARALSPFKKRAGAASSLIGFTQQISAAALGVLVGHWLGASAWPLAAAMAAMGCLMLVLWAMACAPALLHRQVTDGP
jgi:DHA1 family bicyclomycin/chloramphenicol resistance-like MFS transporter